MAKRRKQMLSRAQPSEEVLTPGPTSTEGAVHAEKMQDGVRMPMEQTRMSCLLSKGSRSLGGSLSLVTCIEMPLLMDQGGERP